MEEKQVIRNRIAEQKKKMSEIEIQQKSNHIVEKLFSLSDYIEAECIYAFVNFNQEVVTRQIILNAIDSGKRIAVPKITEKKMKFYFIHSLEDVKSGYMGILEPITEEEATVSNALMLMPGVAFDTNRNRIGYGKGYYDSYLNSHKIKKKIGLAYDFQIVNEIQADEYDIKPDYILTETKIIY